MSSRLQEKERRRETRERELAGAERRRGVRRGLAYVGVTAVALAAVAALLLSSGGGSNHPAPATNPTAMDTPFGQHYEGLSQRRQAAGVPTMMDTMNSSVHFHPLLAVYVNGKQVQVPANIGIDPTQDAMQMAGLHTHDPSGKIHVEGVPGARLGQFFAIWGVPLSAKQLGPTAPAAAMLCACGSTASPRLRSAD